MTPAPSLRRSPAPAPPKALMVPAPSEMPRASNRSEGLPPSYALFDSDDRLVSWNEGFETEMGAVVPRRGLGVATLLLSARRNSAHKDESEDMRAEWLAQRLAQFHAGGTFEYHRTDNRWVRVSETRGTDGGTWRVAIDVTEERGMRDLITLAAADGGQEPALGLYECHRTADGSITFPKVNEVMRRIYDLPPTGEIERDAVISRVCASDHPRLAAALSESIRLGEPGTIAFAINTRFGQRWVRTTFTPRFEASGTVGWSGILSDITREHAAEEQAMLLRWATVHTTDSIMMFETHDGAQNSNVIYVNPACEALTGYKATDLVGVSTQKLRFIPEMREARERVKAAVFRRERVRVEMQIRCADDSTIWVEADAMTVQDFSVDHFRWILIQRDVTRQREARQALQLAASAAEQANRAKSAFLAKMSHELRTPLNAIIGFSTLIGQRLAALPGQERMVEYAGDVQASGEHLLALINDILDVSRIDAEGLTLTREPVLLKTVIAETMGMVRAQCEAKRIALESDCPERLQVDVDRLRFKQCVVNLLSNAAKFTGEGGTIRIVAEPVGHVVRLTVSDNGRGIAAADLARVTTPFVTLGDPLHGDSPGTGLGLAIVKQLVELHGGTLTLQSEVGQGTTATIEIPN